MLYTVNVYLYVRVLYIEKYIRSAFADKVSSEFDKRIVPADKGNGKIKDTLRKEHIYEITS